MEGGGKRSATPLLIENFDVKRRRRFAMPAHSKWSASVAITKRQT